MIVAPETRDWARRLLADEAIADKSSEPTMAAAVSACEKLRRPVCALAGVDGYRALLARALALARAEAPTLKSVQVTPEGKLQGVGESKPQVDHDDSGEILVAHLLGLFLTFLGEALTLQLVRDVFPHLKGTTESAVPLPLETILQEVEQLNNVSERLVSLADQHPLMEEALMTISGNVRDTATLLDVFVRIRSKPDVTPNDAPTEQYKM